MALARTSMAAYRLSLTFVACLLWAALLLLPSSGAYAMKIQEVTSPGGIKAWLVEEHSVPLVAMRFAFEGGSTQDPIGKEGVANFIAGMMDEGAGDLNAQQFQERMESIAMRMSFDDGRDSFYGSFETLTQHRDEAIALLGLALTKPRFDADAADRVRAQLHASLTYAARDPNRVASEQWSALAFAGHPYGRPANGTPQTLDAIKSEDLRTFWKKNFARSNLRVVAVGDIDAATLAKALDTIFGGLPAKAELVAVPDTIPKATERVKIIDMAVPQSVARFGLPAMPRKDRVFIPAYVLNTIIGGGVMSSRLWEEVREKRGLAYSVNSSIQPMRHTSIFAGGVATKNEEIAQSLDLIRGELKRIAADGPTDTEIVNAKSYLTGSFALGFDSNAKIANQLLWIWQEELGMSYVETRNQQINAVSLEDMKRAAKRLFDSQELIITIVGRPKGMGEKG
jgi:zinc protease